MTALNRTVARSRMEPETVARSVRLFAHAVMPHIRAEGAPAVQQA